MLFLLSSWNWSIDMVSHDLDIDIGWFWYGEEKTHLFDEEWQLLMYDELKCRSTFENKLRDIWILGIQLEF